MHPFNIVVWCVINVDMHQCKLPQRDFCLVSSSIRAVSSWHFNCKRSPENGNSLHLNLRNFDNIRCVRTCLCTGFGGQVRAQPRSRSLNTTSSNICLNRLSQQLLLLTLLELLLLKLLLLLWLTPQLDSIAQCLCSIPHSKSCCRTRPQRYLLQPLGTEPNPNVCDCFTRPNWNPWTESLQPQCHHLIRNNCSEF